MGALPRGLLLGVCAVLLAAVLANALPEEGPTASMVVGLAKCADCTRKNMKAEAAFKGLQVAVKCKNTNGEYETKAVGEVDKSGAFGVPLNADLLREDGELKQDCFAQLHSATNKPCPGQEPSWVVRPSNDAAEKTTFVAVAGKMHYSSKECASAFLCDPFHKKHFFHKKSIMIPHFHKKPIVIPHFHKKPVPVPKYKPPTPVPVYTHPTPVPEYKPPTPVYTDPTPIYHPPADQKAHNPKMEPQLFKRLLHHFHKKPTMIPHFHKKPIVIPHFHKKPVPVPEYKPPTPVPVYTHPMPVPEYKPPTPVYTHPTPIYHPPADQKTHNPKVEPQLFKKLLHHFHKKPIVIPHFHKKPIVIPHFHKKPVPVPEYKPPTPVPVYTHHAPMPEYKPPTPVYTHPTPIYHPPADQKEQNPETDPQLFKKLLPHFHKKPVPVPVPVPGPEYKSPTPVPVYTHPTPVPEYKPPTPVYTHPTPIYHSPTNQKAQNPETKT